MIVIQTLIWHMKSSVPAESEVLAVTQAGNTMVGLDRCVRW